MCECCVFFKFNRGFNSLDDIIYDVVRMHIYIEWNTHTHAKREQTIDKNNEIIGIKVNKYQLKCIVSQIIRTGKIYTETKRKSCEYLSHLFDACSKCALSLSLQPTVPKESKSKRNLISCFRVRIYYRRYSSNYRHKYMSFPLLHVSSDSSLFSWMTVQFSSSS